MKKTEEKKVEQKDSNVSDEIRVNNMMSDTAIENALAEIEKEKDDKKKREAKKALCVATYTNRKTRLQLQLRRREDDITKEKLNATKSLLERLIGFETEIKDGVCVPIKGKKIDNDKRLTPTEFEKETTKMDEDFRKKMNESTELYNKQIKELRNSYEGDYRYYIGDYWD